MAPGRDETEKTKRVRRLHRRRGVAHRKQIHASGQAGHFRGQQRRLARGSDVESAAGPVWRGAARRRRDGHAALQQIHGRLDVDVRLRVAGKSGRVHRAVRLFAPAQHQTGHEISRDIDHDRRP